MEENIPWLENNRDSLVVIAVSRICLRLYILGVQPDIITHIDPQELGFDLGKGFCHSIGRKKRKSPPQIHRNLDKITTNDGSSGYTTHDDSEAAEVLDEQARNELGHSTHLINPSPNELCR
ncbi:MAG: 6-hydroxymethylpterin diphosphokinase MptE-like protein [Sedimenticola sp.]